MLNELDDHGSISGRIQTGETSQRLRLVLVSRSDLTLRYRYDSRCPWVDHSYHLIDSGVRREVQQDATAKSRSIYSLVYARLHDPTLVQLRERVLHPRAVQRVVLRQRLLS